VGVREIDDDEGRRLVRIVRREPLVIVWVYQRGLDVISQRGRHVGDGAGDPAEPGDRGDGQQHAGDLVFGRARRQRGGGAPFQADPRCPDRR